MNTDEIWWNILKFDENGWKWWKMMNIDEYLLILINIDEIWLKILKFDETFWNLMKMDETWNKKMNENW